jgi:2-C-methyl-D-erythritol 4-phosphate cytidylyltransferase
VSAGPGHAGPEHAGPGHAAPGHAGPRHAGDVGVLVLAGGSGSRFGAGRNKVYLPLAGRSVLSWSVRTLGALPEVGALVLVTRPSDRGYVEELLAGQAGGAPVEVVAGGADRQGSELAGLRALAGRVRSGALRTVLVHDGARPLVSAGLARAVIDTARAYGGAVPGLDRDELVPVDPDGHPRFGGPDALGPVVAVQTPQGFAAGPLLEAYERAAADGFSGTDTASCVRHYTDLPVHRVPGDEVNIKITYPHDLVVAEAALTADRSRTPAAG